nr:hypothetical protein [Marinobacter sp.]
MCANLFERRRERRIIQRRPAQHVRDLRARDPDFLYLPEQVFRTLAHMTAHDRPGVFRQCLDKGADHLPRRRRVLLEHRTPQQQPAHEQVA